MSSIADEVVGDFPSKFARPIIPADMNHVITTLASGTVIHHWETNQPRAVIILQHGFGEYAERYVDCHRRIVRRLVENSYEVWALDLRGHGRSPGIRGLTNVGQAVQDHLHLRRSIHNGDLPTFLFGHSLGGLVTAGSVIANALTVDGVILTGPALATKPPVFLQWIVNIGARYLPYYRIPIKRQPISGLSRIIEVQERAMADPLMYKGQISFLVASTALQVADSMWQNLEDWKVPTLIIHGVEDKYTDPLQSVRFIDGIAAQDKHIHLTEGGLHEVLGDVDADQNLNLVLEWLSKHIAATAHI